MTEKDQALIDRLSEENPKFRKLYEEHLFFEKRLLEFEEKTYLSADEDLQRKKIQKLKLAGKDEMEEMLRNLRP